MAKACGNKLSHDNSDEGIRPNSKDAIFSLNEETDSIQKLKEEIKKLQEENSALRKIIGKDV